MNWAQIKDPVSHMCFAGPVVAPGLLQKRWLGGSKTGSPPSSIIRISGNHASILTGSQFYVSTAFLLQLLVENQ